MPDPLFELPKETIIAGRYKLLKTLGQGGFGITYRAYDMHEACSVVLKECFPVGICMRDPESGGIRPVHRKLEERYLHAMNDMRKETKTLSGIRHKHIVNILDIIWGNGSVFYVMPWLSGGTLREMIDAQPTSITAEQSIDWLRKLLGALRYLHDRGIIHRDIKPANIMFDEQGEPILIDFGAALNRPERTTDTTTTQGAFSRSYAAPEQITGKGHVGPWTDIYSLSATWYELLTGKQPEEADGRLMRDDLQPLAENNVRFPYPIELLAVLRQNMALRPAERCQSVDQWVQCWEDGTLPKLTTISKKTSRNAWLVGGALVALGVGVALLAWKNLKTEDSPLREGGQPAVNEATSHLVNRVRTAASIDELERICNEYLQKNEELVAEQQKRMEVLLTRFRNEADKVATHEDADRLSTRFEDERSALSRAFLQERKALADRFTKAHNQFPTSSAVIRKSVRVESVNEEVLLPALCQEIADEGAMRVANVYSDFALRGGKCDETALRAYSKILKEMSEKAL